MHAAGGQHDQVQSGGSLVSCGLHRQSSASPSPPTAQRFRSGMNLQAHESPEMAGVNCYGLHGAGQAKGAHAGVVLSQHRQPAEAEFSDIIALIADSLEWRLRLQASGSRHRSSCQRTSS